MTLISDFVSRVQAIQKTGAATEHSYRSAFEGLFASLGATALNEPKRVKCGAPDFIVSQGEIVIGHVEAKDLHISIRGMKDSNKAQQERYKAALPNLIYTNGLDWDFYRDGDLTASVTIADFVMGVIPKPKQYATLENLLRDFIAQKPQTITSPRELAERMAGKANLIKDVLRKTLADDKAFQSELSSQYQAFKENLIHDITPEDFADIYAETIAYGMFAARLHDSTQDTFSRQEALELLPKSNPFLRSLFSYVAGYDLDERIAWIIDDLARVFQACDMAKIMEGFGKLTGQDDPFLHFYETFLAAYNPAKRKARGVWYTPEPVVNFIVRAVDEVLQTEFGLADGLADTSKVTIDWDTGQTDKKGKAITIKKEVHRVQILDPATGTGTFLAEVIKQIAPRIQGVAPGMWSQYIEQDLIPRLHGFELLMASYAMCHMKIDMILTEMGYKPTGNPPRLSVYLTNSLEEGEPANQTLPFTQWLSREAKGANTIKRDMPIMCVIGNPPYSVSSSNKGSWISSLLADYKSGLNERKINLDDDYIKFIRLAHALVEKNGQGIVGFITNNSFLDGITHRRMREKILEDFCCVYVVDLHGSVKRKEVAPDGGLDNNVFDIQQGVSIIILVKRKLIKGGLASVKHVDLWGRRSAKYEYLSSNSLHTCAQDVNPIKPYYFFKPKNWAAQSEYEVGFPITDFFTDRNSGIQTKRDVLNVAFSGADISKRIDDLRETDSEDFRKKYALPEDGRDWSVDMARADVLSNPPLVVEYNYRPLDNRFTAYTGNSKGIQAYPRSKTSNHILRGDNISLCTCRQLSINCFAHAFCTNLITDLNSVSINSKEQTYFFPLYLYPDNQDLDKTRRVNFDPKLYKRLQKLAAHPEHGTPDELQVFNYIYGVLHCPAYRDTYAEFLKIDFPRIPWPANPDEFWDVSAKGAELRKLHLMDPATIGPTPYPFTGDGDNVVDKPRFEDGRVWINANQYFDSAPEVSWGFFIGGYQPAQKWLKDRKGRALNFDDVKHYQRILKILAETHRIMRTISMTLDVPA